MKLKKNWMVGNHKYSTDCQSSYDPLSGGMHRIYIPKIPDPSSLINSEWKSIDKILDGIALKKETMNHDF